MLESETRRRRQAMMECISEGKVSTQQELVDVLCEKGFAVTQATLSRDLKALGVGKVPREGGGYMYVVLESIGKESVRAQPKSSLEIEVFVRKVKVINNLLLVNTTPGNAHGVGRAMDELGFEEIEGTIAGDDTLLIVTASVTRAHRLQQRIHALMVKGRRRG